MAKKLIWFRDPKLLWDLGQIVKNVSGDQHINTQAQLVESSRARGRLVFESIAIIMLSKCYRSSIIFLPQQPT